MEQVCLTEPTAVRDSANVVAEREKNDVKEAVDETEEDDGDNNDDNVVNDVSEIQLLDSAVRTFINLVSWGCFFKYNYIFISVR